MLRAIIVDDEIPALEWLDNILVEIGSVHLAGAYTDPIEALDQLKTESIDIVFLDIEMPGMNGLELAERMLTISPATDVVFVTAYHQYALEAFEYYALDYVLKPASAERIRATLAKVSARRGNSMNRVKANGKGEGFQSFGRFEWMHFSEPDGLVKWRTAKVRELAAYLVHNRNQWVNKDKVQDDLWGDEHLEQSRTYLYTCVYNLRKKLLELGFEELLKSDQNRYRLEIEPFWSDVNEFMVATEEVTAVDASNVEQLEHVASLYRGDYMEEDSFLWAVDDQDQYRERYIALLRQLSDYYVTDRNYSPAIDCLRRILEKNPFLDDVNEQMIRLYARIGDRLSMIRHFEKFTSELKRDLGIEPLERTVRLYEHLRSGRSEDSFSS